GRVEIRLAGETDLQALPAVHVDQFDSLRGAYLVDVPALVGPARALVLVHRVVVPHPGEADLQALSAVGVDDAVPGAVVPLERPLLVVAAGALVLVGLVEVPQPAERDLQALP